MGLWYLVRPCFLWLPVELFLLCRIAFGIFGALFLFRLVSTILDIIPIVL